MTADLTVRASPGARCSHRSWTGSCPSRWSRWSLARLLFVARPATPDEGGFLVVASQWHVGGTSLYGDYWVDRPPLLIGLFRLADLTGGLTALRLIGALAAAVTVGAARIDGPTGVRTPGGDRDGRGAPPPCWSPRCTARRSSTVSCSPRPSSRSASGSRSRRCDTDDPLAARGAALGAGLAAVLALLVKQNMADVVVFAAACWVRRLAGAPHLRPHAAPTWSRLRPWGRAWGTPS